MNNRRYRSYDSNSRNNNNSLLGAAPMGRQDTGFNNLSLTQQLQQQQMNLLREQQKQLAMAMNLGQMGGLQMQSQGLGMGMMGMGGLHMGNLNMDRNNDRRPPLPLLDSRQNPMRRGGSRGARQSYQSRSQGGYGSYRDSRRYQGRDRRSRSRSPHRDGRRYQSRSGSQHERNDRHSRSDRHRSSASSKDKMADDGSDESMEVMDELSETDDLTEDVVIIDDDNSQDAKIADLDSPVEVEDETTEPEEPEKGENILTVTLDEKGRSVTKDDKKMTEAEKAEEAKAAGKFYCHACRVTTDDSEKHIAGSVHKQTMENLLRIHSETTQEETPKIDAQKKDDKKQVSTKEVSKKGLLKNDVPTKHDESFSQCYCKICNLHYHSIDPDRHNHTDAHKRRDDLCAKGCKLCGTKGFESFIQFREHSETSKHIKNISKKQNWPKCDICNQMFKSPRKFVHHCSTEAHKMKKEERQSRDHDKRHDAMVTVDAIGSRHDAMVTVDAIGSFVDETEEDFDVAPYDPNVAIGQSFVGPIQGFFCRLCLKFYNKEKSATVEHCKSQSHYEKYKNDREREKAKLLARKKKLEDEEKAVEEETGTNEEVTKEENMDEDSHQTSVENPEVPENAEGNTDTLKENDTAEDACTEAKHESMIDDADKPATEEFSEGPKNPEKTNISEEDTTAVVTEDVMKEDEDQLLSEDHSDGTAEISEVDEAKILEEVPETVPKKTPTRGRGRGRRGKK